MLPKLAFSLSRGCGNPTGFADLRPGEVVVDFGCGAGIDVILASQYVGPGGRVVGIDFSHRMIERANQAVSEAGLAGRDIRFHIGEMEKALLPSSFASVVISNCVINLCPDKDAVYQEAFRILKPGGRLAISDIVLTKNIGSDLRDRFRSTWPGCLGGAIPEDDYWQTIRKTGFGHVQIVDRHCLFPDELKAMACCPGEEFTPPPAEEDLAQAQGKVASVKFTAVRAPELQHPSPRSPEEAGISNRRRL